MMDGHAFLVGPPRLAPSYALTMAGEATHLPALDAYADLEDIDNAAQALCLVVAAFQDDDLLPLDALYTNLEPCKLVLTRHAELYTMLKESHRSRNFDPVRNHNALRRQKRSLELANKLSKWLPALIEFIERGGPVTWSLQKEVDDDVHAHIASLRLPTGPRGGPSVLLRDLGRFSDDETLANRVENIFVQGHHTFLVNTSGSGKTRLTFEGLCQHWGFYFVGAIDSIGIGSPDLKELLQLHIPHEGHPFREEVPPDPDKVAENVKITHQCLRQLLLSRLLVFSLFAEHIHAAGIKPEHKKLWLQIQAMPQAVGGLRLGDIFSGALMQVCYSDDTHTTDYIAHLLAKLRHLFGAGFHMFFVIDEAQVIFKYHEEAYRDDDGAHYPILREILDGLSHEFREYEISFVTAGTEIPKSGFQKSRNVDRHRWCSDTGAFDDESVHREYVSRYLPPPYLATKAGKAFLKLVWDWCRGRYRATDTLLGTLARDGFQSPHTLLNDYVETATGYRPDSNLEFAATENQDRDQIGITNINCRVLEYPGYASLTSALRDVLFHYSVTGQPPPPFSGDHIVLITLGFGRFIDSQMSRIIVDEPIMLVSAARWFCTARPDPYASDGLSPRASFLDIIQGYPPISSRVLATSVMTYLTHAFTQGYPVYKVFSFPRSPPAWAKQRAEIVALNQPDRRPAQYSVADSFTPVLAATPTSPEDTILLLTDGGSESPPFLLHSAGNPDLVCVLRLAEGTFLRIVVHASASAAVLQGPKLREVVQNMATDNLFALEVSTSPLRSHFFSISIQSADNERVVTALQTLPPRSSAASRPSILRIVASFPASAYLNSVPINSTRAMASLNTSLFKTLMAKIPASEIFDEMVETVVLGKRKRSPVVRRSARVRGRVD
ncbi:hypothetical protein DFH09DRAFT_1275168 [Mycena vulgaris]|nr:hypothetical protein DFH09DRAFT_1275168 [Mycena vulgaris]